MRFRPTTLLLLACAVSWVASAGAAEPLHARIDRALEKGTPNFKKLVAVEASDEEFLRRVYLDLVGNIPTAEEARAFLKDKRPDRRERLIDRLLASPEHARHLALTFDVILLERRVNNAVSSESWRDFLQASFAKNRPWDELVRDILGADGTDPKTRPAAKFYLDRAAEPHTITRDIGRMFLGIDLQCAQCHDHPLVDDYKQDWYYGLFAFVNRTYQVTDPKLRLAVLGERAEGEATYQSVFDPAKATKTSPPRVPGRQAIKEPTFPKGKEYKVPPVRGQRSVPQFSRREQLASELARADNPAFVRNLVNRLWALVMGVGLIHPVDMAHSDNPPSHPEVLEILCNDPLAKKFDVRGLLRELLLTKAYQRSSVLPAGVKDFPARTFAVAYLKPLRPEQLAFALHQATGMTALDRQALGKSATEPALHVRVQRQVAPLINLFSGPAGQAQEFEPTLDQALFLSNNALLRSWLTPRAGTLVDRLLKLTDAEVAAEAYLSVLTRMPAAEEAADVLAHLKSRKNRTEAMQELVWALLTSAEFRFNH